MGKSGRGTVCEDSVLEQKVSKSSAKNDSPAVCIGSRGFWFCRSIFIFFLTLSRKDASICKVLTEDSRYLSFQIVSQYLAELRKPRM